MPLWVASLVGGFLEVMASMVGRVLIALGLGVVTYNGLDAGLSFFRQKMIDSLGSAGANVAGMAGVLQLDVVLSILIAAATMKLLINGASGGAIKRWVGK